MLVVSKCRISLICKVGGGLNVVLPKIARKHEISRTLRRIHVVLVIVIVYVSQMCHIVFGDDMMHINEGGA